jgi:hypothetical protein
MLTVDLQLVTGVISAPEIPAPVYVRNILLEVASNLLSHGTITTFWAMAATMGFKGSSTGGL